MDEKGFYPKGEDASQKDSTSRNEMKRFENSLHSYLFFGIRVSILFSYFEIYLKDRDAHILALKTEQCQSFLKGGSGE